MTGRSRAWGLVGLWMAVIAVGSLTPGGPAVPWSNVLQHVFAYGVLAWLVARALRQRSALVGALLSAAIAWGFGLAIEGAQAFHPHRAFEARDLIANGYGAGLGGLAALLSRAGAASIAMIAALGAAGVGSPALSQPSLPPPGTLHLGKAYAHPAEVASAAHAGFRAVKVLADWSTIEAQRGAPAWGDLDRTVAAVAQAGLSPVVVLAHTPRWASVGTGADLLRAEVYSRQPPRDLRDWARFAGAAAARYRGRVRDWQVWTQLGLPEFRGSGSEYLNVLQHARAGIRNVDTTARVAAATPAGVDLAFIAAMLANAPDAFDVIALAPHGVAPEALLRPLAVLSGRMRGTGKSVWIEWAPEATVSADLVGGAWTRVHAVAQAAGVERLFASGTARVDPGLRQAGLLLGPRPYAGYLVREPGVFAPVFGGAADGIVVAWAHADERALALPGGAEVRVTTLDGKLVTPEDRDGRAVVRLTDSPVVVSGIAQAVLDEARATLAQRGPLLPLVAPEHDYSRSAEVQARLGAIGEERGLYNRPYRTRRNGAVEPVEIGGVEAVRTSAARQVVYVYFDVDDTFLYFAEGRVPLDVTVEVWGATAARRAGLNLLYDSTSGYRFTPWQWVEAREGWVRVGVRLTDVNFSNTWGFDFAVNAAGNRGEDLIVRSVTVRKGAP